MRILIHISVVLGFANDTNSVFSETVKFLKKNSVSTVSFNVLTPYPGNKTYQDLNKENRLITTDWRYYNHNTAVFKPKNTTSYELQMGKVNARKKFIPFLQLINDYIVTCLAQLFILLLISDI